MIRTLTALATACLLVLATPLSAPAQDLPQDLSGPTADADAFEPLYPLIGRTWRGAATGQDGVEDIVRWDWAVGGHAVRAVHSVNGGLYGGETLIFPDRDSGRLIFHYFTSGGFHTTGTIRQTGPGAFEVEETVHGIEGLERLRSTMVLGGDGTYQTRSQVERDGEWAAFGGFDYRVEGSARVTPPARSGVQATVQAGPLTLSRRLVANPGEPGQDAAGYLRITVAGAGGGERLIAASCACAARIELHRIRRDGPTPGMVSDSAWDVSAEGGLDVRPGGDLHLMLMDFDPASAADGRVTLTLTFERAGPVEAAFDLATDSRSAWTRFEGVAP